MVVKVAEAVLAVAFLVSIATVLLLRIRFPRKARFRSVTLPAIWNTFGWSSRSIVRTGTPVPTCEDLWMKVNHIVVLASCSARPVGWSFHPPTPVPLSERH